MPPRWDGLLSLELSCYTTLGEVGDVPRMVTDRYPDRYR